jgi:replicative DNA helicase
VRSGTTKSKQEKLSDKDQKILGAILRAGFEEHIDPSSSRQNWRSVVDILDESRFDTPLAQEIYAAILSIKKSGEVLDEINLLAQLKRCGCFNDEKSYVDDDLRHITAPELYDLYENYATLESVFDEVARQNIRRKQIEAANIAEKMRAASLAGNDEEFYKCLLRMKDVRGSESERDMTFEEILNSALLKALEIETAGGVRLKTGYPELDDKIVGYMGADIITIFGHPAQGKTASAMNLIVRSIATGAKIMLITIEDSKERMALRYMSIKLGVSVKGLYSGKTGQQGWAKISAGRNSVITDKLIIIDDAYTLPDIYRRVLIHKPDILFVDHIHIMKLPKADSKEQSVAALMTGFKHMSKEENIPIVLLAQTRKSPTRVNHPSIDDLYYSKDIENISSVAMSVSWPWKVEETKSEFEYSWMVQKARIGNTGMIPMLIDKFSLGIFGEKESLPQDFAARVAGVSLASASYGGGATI